VDVFISHSAKDADDVSAVGDAFRTAGVSAFQSSDARSHGSSIAWINSLEGGLDACRLGVFLVTPSYIDSPWLLFELGWMRGRAKAEVADVLVFGVGVALSDLPGPVLQYQVLNLATDMARALRPTMNRSFADTHSFGDEGWGVVRDALVVFNELHVTPPQPTPVSDTIEPQLATVLNEENESAQLTKIDQSSSGLGRVDEALKAVRVCREAVMERFVENDSYSRTLLIGDLVRRFGAATVENTIDAMLEVDELTRRGNVLMRGRRYGFHRGGLGRHDPWF